MAARSPLELTMEKWNRRQQVVQQAGFGDNLIKELMRRDLDDVKRGGNPLTNQEVNLAIVNQILGKNVIDKPERESGWQNIPGNFVNDVGDIARGFIPGLVEFVRDLPEHTANTGKILTDDKTWDNGPGEILRDVAAAPLVGLIPGITTAAQVTTPEGRTSLAQHPAMALLDVLPVAGKVGKVATKNAIATPGSAIEALQQGRVVRAGFRATMDTVARLPKMGNVADRAKYVQMAENLGVSPQIREALAVPYNRLLKKSQRDMLVLFNDRIKPIFDGLDPADHDTLYRMSIEAPDNLSAVPQLVADPAKHAQLVNTIAEVRRFNDELAETGLGTGNLVKVPYHGKTFTYSKDSPVARNYDTYKKNVTVYGKVRSTYAKLEQKLKAAEERLVSGSGKVRHFMEDAAAYDARLPGPIGPDTVVEAIRPFMEAWRHLDPEKVFGEYSAKIVDGELRRAAATQLGKDFRVLKGEEGLVAKLNDLLAEGNIKEASKVATKIASIFKHKAWEGANTTANFRSFFAEIRDSLQGLGRKSRRSTYHYKVYANAKRNLANQQRKMSNWHNRTVSTYGQYIAELERNPAPNFTPMVVESVKSRARQVAEGTFDPGTAELVDALRAIDQSPTFTAIQAAVGKEAFDLIYKDVVENWVDLVKQGYNPIWIHHVAPDRYEQVLRTRVLPDQNMKPSQFRDTVFNFGPSVMDVRAAITAAASELISYKATDMFVNNHLMKFARPNAEVFDEYLRMYEGQVLPAGVDVKGWAEREMNKRWSTFDPTQYGVSSFIRPTDADGMVLPIGVDHALKTMMGEGKKIPLVGAYDKVMQVYKYSVLTGPRHLADEAFGGLVMLALREPMGLGRATAAMFGGGKAAQLARDWRTGGLSAAEDSIMTALMHPLYDLPTHEIAEFASGKTMARLLKGVGWGPQKLMQLEEWISNVQRVSAYITAEKRLDKSNRGARSKVTQYEREVAAAFPGSFTEEKAAINLKRARGELAKGEIRTQKEALDIALKTFIDVDSMLPIERTVLKRIFPFYAWIRHSFRYMMTLPTDHPVRVAVITRFAAMEQADWDSTLPDKFKSFFWFGDADEDGKTFTIDWRAANPWRDFASNFTLAGFLSSMSPLATAGFEAAGVDTLGAVPEMFPEMTYDPVTGSMKTTRTDTIPKIIESFIPQFGLLDAAAGITERMRRLRQSNPEAFRRELWNNLNMPFPPTFYDPTYERQRSEINRTRSASREVSAAKRRDDWSDAKRYNLVPFQGELVEPQTLEKLSRSIAEILREAGVDVNPFSVVPR